MMNLTLPWPVTQGEWLAWASAAATVLVGLFFLFAPRLGLRVLRLQAAPDRPDVLAAVRANFAGFPLALGLMCLLLSPQPWLYMALGFSWLLVAFGRLVAILSDRGATLYNLIALVFDLALAGLPLAYVFGFAA